MFCREYETSVYAFLLLHCSYIDRQLIFADSIAESCPTRLNVAVMLFMSAFTCYVLRVNMSINILGMVQPTTAENKTLEPPPDVSFGVSLFPFEGNEEIEISDRSITQNVAKTATMITVTEVCFVYLFLVVWTTIRLVEGRAESAARLVLLWIHSNSTAQWRSVRYGRWSHRDRLCTSAERCRNSIHSAHCTSLFILVCVPNACADWYAWCE